MRRHSGLLQVLAAVAAVAAGSLTAHAAPSAPAPASGTQPCDRACLTGFVDRYLDALVAHDPSRLPLSKDVKFTENTVRLNLGEALWSTATGVGAQKVYLADPYSGQAGFVGVVMENRAPKFLALRLRIKNGQITDIETIVARQGLMGGMPKDLSTRTAKPIWNQALTGPERVSREKMLWASNQYFEGMEQNTGEVVPFDDSCNRTENGTQTTNNPALLPPGSPTGLAQGCKGQFNAGGVDLWSTPERRFWMVDEEKGLVLGLFMFTVTGIHDPKIPTSPDGPSKNMLGGLDEPGASGVAEIFKIKTGRIHEIEAVMALGLPYGARSGW
jgi:hypothetical protein